MSTTIAIASSQSRDIQEAAYQTASSIKRQLETPQVDLVILMACGAHACAETLTTISSILQPQRLVGSSTTGIILSNGTMDQGLAILAINSTQITFGIATSNMVGPDPRNLGFEWGHRLNEDLKTRHQACLMFADQLLPNNMSFIRGAQEVLGFGCHVAGGISNARKPSAACQFYQDQVLTQSAVGLLISGTNIAVSARHGFKPLGKPRSITKARQNIIQMIDHQPAVHIYEEFLGPEADKLKEGSSSPHRILYPLGLYLEEQGQYLIKNAVDILVDGSIVCQGDVLEGTEVHLLIGNRDSCRNSAVTAAVQIKNSLGEKAAKLILIIESAARHQILKTSFTAQLQAIKDVLGNHVPLFGFCSDGEVVSFVPGHSTNSTFIQNESITILTMD